ncbi:MAG: zinc transporter ZntB [Celeribacter sp.]|jgi:zinc transporter
MTNPESRSDDDAPATDLPVPAAQTLPHAAPQTICAFDVTPSGEARAVAPGDITPVPGPGAIYRWLHFDLREPGLEAWLRSFLHPIPVRAMLDPETRPRCEPLDEGLMLNLRGVNLNEGEDFDDMISLRLWVAPGLIVSGRFRKIFAVDAMRQRMETGDAPASTGSYLARLLAELTMRTETFTVKLEDDTDDLEEDILDDGMGEEGQENLGPMRRSAIKLRRHLGPQRDALTRLLGQEGLFSKSDRNDLRETLNRLTRMVEELETSRDRLAAMQDHLDVQQQARMGRNGYVLSVVAAIFLPLGFFTGLFGVNVAGMPGTDWPWAFATLSLAMTVLALLLFIVFRWRDWL